MSMPLFRYLCSNRHLSTLMVCAISITLLYDLCPAFISLDTPYYIAAGYNWASGNMDCLREPLYPLLVYICSLPFGESGRMVLITLIQNIFFLLSVPAFYRMAQRVVKHPVITFSLTLFYIITPMAGWCKAIHTESLSTSFCILFSYWLFRIINIRKLTVPIGIITAFAAAFLVVFKSTFIIFLVILPILYILLMLQNNKSSNNIRRFNRGGGISLLLLIIPLYSHHTYCKTYEKKFGIYSSSISTICCNYINLWQSGLYQPHDQFNATPEQKEAIKILDSLSAMPPIISEANYDKLYYIISTTKNAKIYKSASEQMIDNVKSLYIQYRLKRLASEIQRPFYPAIGDGNIISFILYATTSLIFIPLSFMLLILTISTINLFRILIQHRKIPIHYTLLIMILGSYCTGIFLMGSDSFSRLLLPVYPIMLLLFGNLINNTFSWLQRHSSRT